MRILRERIVHAPLSLCLNFICVCDLLLRHYLLVEVLDMMFGSIALGIIINQIKFFVQTVLVFVCISSYYRS